jgi:hypothetical protein
MLCEKVSLYEYNYLQDAFQHVKIDLSNWEFESFFQGHGKFERLLVFDDQGNIRMDLEDLKGKGIITSVVGNDYT